MRVSLRGWDCTVRTFVPEGLSESSPVRSAGLVFFKSIRPRRDDRRMLAIAEPRARPKALAFLSSLTLTGRTCFLLHFPALRTGLLSSDPCGTDFL